MRFETLSLVGLGMGLTTAFAVAAPADAVLPYDVVPMTYKGVVDGAEVTINGTVQQVVAELKAHHPKVERDMSGELVARNKIPPPSCNPAGNFASVQRINQGIAYLNSLPGSCGVGAGPHVCARISCSYNSAIFLCNDNSGAIAPSCKYLSSYAADIVNRCSNGNGQVIGQEFDTDKYNILVKADSC